MERLSITCSGTTTQVWFRHMCIVDVRSLLHQPSSSLLSHPYLHNAWFFALILFAGLTGCGPAVSGPDSNQMARTSQAAPAASSPASQQSTTPQPAPSAPSRVDDVPPQPDTLVLPVWMAQALDAPDVSVRLNALDKWAKLGNQASFDPLVAALDDDNDDVRNKAMEIIEQRWTEEQETESEPDKHGETGAARP